LKVNDESPVQTPTPDLGRQAEFVIFMRKHQNMVYSTAARLTGNATQAEDIAQETFLKAYLHFAALESSPAAAGWLKTVATNLSLNHLYRYRSRWRFFSELRRAEGAEAGEGAEVDFPAEDELATLDTKERHELVEQALARLPDHQRVPLVLFHFEDFSYEEIAKKLSVSTAKIRTDIQRGRAALAIRLQRAGLDPEAGKGGPR
jgi:RNA polymerase sigma-70 factor (ECF subfamily)